MAEQPLEGDRVDNSAGADESKKKMYPKYEPKPMSSSFESLYPQSKFGRLCDYILDKIAGVFKGKKAE